MESISASVHFSTFLIARVAHFNIGVLLESISVPSSVHPTTFARVVGSTLNHPLYTFIGASTSQDTWASIMGTQVAPLQTPFSADTHLVSLEPVYGKESEIMLSAVINRFVTEDSVQEYACPELTELRCVRAGDIFENSLLLKDGLSGQPISNPCLKASEIKSFMFEARTYTVECLPSGIGPNPILSDVVSVQEQQQTQGQTQLNSAAGNDSQQPQKQQHVAVYMFT